MIDATHSIFVFTCYSFSFAISFSLTIYYAGKGLLYGVYHKYMNEFMVVSAWLFLTLLYQMQWSRVHFERTNLG